VALAYNPSYSGGRNQEDYSSKPAQANSSRDPIKKTPSQKSAGGMTQGVDPEFKIQYRKKKKKRKERKKMVSPIRAVARLKLEQVFSNNRFLCLQPCSEASFKYDFI
jgi:hypothetical protein